MSVRDYLMNNYEGSKKSAQWIDLWSTASSVDMRLAMAAQHGVTARDHALLTDDIVEVGLRRLAAYVHAHRTGDSVAATRMLAVKPPGANTDIAPEWLVTEASGHSHWEYKRTERVKAMSRMGQQKGDQWGKGRGKGKKKGHGEGSGGGGASGHPQG